MASMSFAQISRYMEEFPAIFLIILAIIVINDPSTAPQVAVILIVVAIGAVVGAIASKLQQWWGGLVSIVASVIGILYFAVFAAEIFYPELIASSAIGAGGLFSLVFHDD